MGADNWAQCPKCKKIEETKIKNLELELEKSYGMIPLGNFNIKQQEIIEIKQKAEKKLTTTLREDYEIGIWNGIFEIIYTSSCNVCGFQYKFKSSEQLKL